MAAAPIRWRFPTKRKALIADFLEAVRNRHEPVVSGREAVKVQVLIEAMLQSSAEGRAVPIKPTS